MISKFRYLIIDSLQIIIEQYYGLITFDELINIKTKIFADKRFSLDYDTIIDFSSAELRFKALEMDKYYDFFANIVDTINCRRVAYLSDTPDKVVKTTLFVHKIEANIKYNIKTQIFYTFDAMFNWISFDSHKQSKIKEIFYSMKRELSSHPNSLFEG